jgi:hypothetical protein
MPNGKAGDHPITDIVNHRLKVYSERVDGLIREIVALGGRNRISNLLVSEFSHLSNPDLRETERVFTGIRDELKGQSSK